MAWSEKEFAEKLAQGTIAIVKEDRKRTATKQKPTPLEKDPLYNVLKEGSGVEYTFAAGYLEERVESGVSMGWAFEPCEIRMVGHTYTPDFVEFGTDAIVRWYEVKGAKKIPSQDRSSAKYRTTAALFESDLVQFYWAKQKKDGTFLPKKLPKQGKRDRSKYLAKK